MAYRGCASSLRVEKVSKIFTKFDVNQDGHLSREEMSALVVAVNPKLNFKEDQIAAILDEVFRTYGDYIDGDQGLSFDGMLQTYDDGAGDINRDFNALGLVLERETEASIKECGNETSGACVFIADDTTSSTRRKRTVGSWAAGPKNGIAYDGTWGLIEDLEILIRCLEDKMDKKGRSSDSCTARIGWARAVDCSTTSEVVIGKKPWEELGQDYSQFQKELVEIRKKADGSGTQEEAFDAHMASGRILFDHKLYREALLSFKRAVEIKPTDVRPHFQEGNTLYALGETSEAREAYTLALDAGEIDADQWGNLLPQIHVNLGITLEAEGMLLGASEHYKEAAIKEPKHYRALKLLGSALYGVGEYKAAKEALLEAIFLNADYADAHCELGLVLHALGDHDEAITQFQKAIELKSDHMEALYNFGTLLIDIGQYGRAANTYSKVLALQPGNWRAQLNRAVSLLGAGEVDESKRALREAYKLTGRSELHDAMVHLQHKEKRPKGLSSFLRRGEVNLGIVGESFRAEDNFIIVESARFRRANARTTPRHWLASALDIRHFQSCTRFNQCDIANVKKELNQTLLPVSSSHVGIISEKSIRKEALEKLIRRLLHFLNPEAYQGAMKVINEKILAVLDPTGSGRVDLGMVFAVLAPVCGGAIDRRKHMAFDALVYHASKNVDGEISKQDAIQYVKILRAAYLPSQMASNQAETTGDEDHTSISFPEFVEMLDDPDRGFGILSILTKLEMEDHVRHGRQTCSVCCYPIIGPRFKETKSNFSLCSLCYSSGKVPSTAKHEEFYYFKEYNSELEAVKERLQIFKSPFASCSELRSEKVNVPSSKPYITFQGPGASLTTISWHDTTSSSGSTQNIASMAMNSHNFIARGITFRAR